MTVFTGVHHVALTVSDITASVAWYCELFGMTQVMEEPHDRGRAVILRHPGSGLFLGLHTHDADSGGAFTETRTGLDHMCLSVPDRATLRAWQQRLRDHGVPQSPIADRSYGQVLVFRDPDNIQLELIAPPAPTATPDREKTS